MFKNPFQVAISFAVIALVVKLLIFTAGAQHGAMEDYIRYIYMLILLTAVFFGIRSNKMQSEGPTSFGQDFKAGARTASFFAIIVAGITYVYYAKIDAHFFEVKQAPLLEESLTMVKEKITAGEETKKEITEWYSNQLYGMKTFLSPYFQSIWTLFGLVFMGMFNSIIFAFLMKKMPGFKQ